MPVHNEDLAAAFDEMADLLALSADNPFRINAYRRAAQVVRSLPDELQSKVAAGFDPDELPGIGPDLAKKIRAFLENGELSALTQLRRTVPTGLREIMQLPNMGPKRVRALHESLGILDLETLRAALATHRIRTVRGFGPKMEERLVQAVGNLTEQSHRLLRSVSERYAVALQNHLQQLPGIARVEVAGSFRRGRETVGDLDFLVCAVQPIDIGKALLGYDETASLIVGGPTRSSVVLKSGVQIDVRVVHPTSFGAALLYFTGSKAHNVHIRRIAQEYSLKVNEYGVFRGKQRIAGDSEASVFKAVGLPYIAPELREDRGEIEAAQVGKLPVLVTRDDLRGDLHVHTLATDGTTSLQAMAEAAKQAGLEYIAITDHSRHIGAVHGLDASALARQLDQIDALNFQLDGIALLKGIEVDILEDGSLALPDTVLKKLDVVVVAIHDHFGLSRRRQTERLLRAFDRPHVSILAHPATRLIEERAAIDCEWGKIFRRAYERPLYLELNAQPTRLDLDDVLVREAAAHEVLISVASDAHSGQSFNFLAGGILQARRGWLTKAQVLNTRPLMSLRRLLKKTFLA